MKKENLFFLVSFLAYPGYYLFLGFLMLVNVPTLTPSLLFRTSYLLLVLTLLAIGSIQIRKDLITAIFLLYAGIVVSKIALIPSLYPGIEFSRPTIHYLGYFLLLGVVPFFAFKGIRLREAYNRLEGGFLWGGLILVIFCVISYREVITSGVGRLSESAYINVNYTTINPLSISYSAAISGALAWVKLQERGSSRLLYISVMLIAAFGILLGSSKGALLGFGLTFFLVLGKTRISSVSTWVSLAMLCFGVYTLIQNSSSNLFHRLSELGTDNSSTLRLQYFHDAFDEFRQNPICGGRLELNGTYPHNYFIELLMCTGLVGAITSLILITLCLKGLYTHHRNFRMFPVVLFSIGFIYSMVSDSMFSSILLYSSLGLAANTTFENKTTSLAN